jgi:MFS family permease
MIRTQNRWWIVAACVVGLVCSGGPVNVFAFGVFLRPVSDDLHIGRGVLAGAMLWTNMIAAVSGPVLGMLLDRYGGRRVLLIGIVLFAVATSVQAFMTASIVGIYLLFVVRGLGSSGPSPTSYAFVVSRWFDRRRGLALGIAMSGVGLGTTIIPPIAAWLIGAYGWRAAYVGLGAVILVLGGLPVLLLVRDPGERERAVLPHLAEAALPGLTMREALTGTWRFWGMAFAFVLIVIALNGTLTQIVAMLMDRGWKLQAATGVLAASGAAAIAGRLLSGWCVDRFHGPYVAAGFFMLPMIGTALFGSGLGQPAPLFGALLCGLALGAEIDLMGFFVSRYFGLKSYGRILGTMFGIFAAAIGIGPYLSGKSFDLYHSYGPAFRFYEAILVVAIIVLVPLGRYPYPARHCIAATAPGGEKVAA